MNYIGIDPGLSGAIAFLGKLNAIIIVDTPVLEVEKSGKTKSGNPKKKNEYAVQQMREILHTFKYTFHLPNQTEDIHCFIEKSQPMPEQGVTSTFSIGYGFGLWIGLLTALNIPYTIVHPKTWKKKVMMDMGKDKSASIQRATQLYPESVKYIHLKKHDGRAEALLIAHYGKQYGGVGWLRSTHPSAESVECKKRKRD